MPISRHVGRIASRCRGWTLAIALLASALPGPSGAAEVPADRSARDDDAAIIEVEALDSLAQRLRRDLADLITAPARLNRQQWERVALAAAVIAAAAAVDDEMHAAIGRPHDPVLDEVARAIRPLGQEAGLGLVGGLWVGGRISDNDSFEEMGSDGLEAVILSAGIITPILKEAFGRSRPRDGDGSATLLGGGSSFPSGEATHAFAIASVLAAHSERRWVDWICWAAATLVAWQRMRLDAHWASDVVGGAIIGAAVGRWVVYRNREQRLVQIHPAVGDGAFGIVARIRF